MREILHLVEVFGAVSGVSLVALALALLVVPWVPYLRLPAAVFAIMVVVAYFGFLYAENDGRSSVKAAWAAADAKAAKEAAARDTSIAAKLSADNPCGHGSTKGVDDNERKLLAELAGKAGTVSSALLLCACGH